MTTRIDPRRTTQSQPVINLNEPARKPAPILEVGAIAWMRQNLFKSWADTLITILAGLLAVGVVVSLIRWAIGSANWYVVTFNLRLFLIGRYEPAYETRVALAALVLCFVGGFTFAAYARASRTIQIITVAILAALFIVPALVYPAIDLPPTYFTAGNQEVISGSSRLTPLTQVAFIAQADETITLAIADQFTGPDETVATLNSFADIAANQIRAAADNRVTAIARRAEIEAALAGNAITANQRARLEQELNRLSIDPLPVQETYNLNNVPIQVRVLEGQTLDEVGAGVLTTGGDPVTITLPEDGWYVLEKSVADDSTGLALIEAHGIHPILEREVTATGEALEDGSTVIGGQSRVEQYVRMTDRYTIEDRIPRVEGDDLPFANIIDNQFRGQGTFARYLRLYVATFFAQINVPVLLLVLAVVAGYGAARLVDAALSPRDLPRFRSQRWSLWLMFLAPLAAFALIYTIPPGVVSLGLISATALGVFWAIWQMVAGMLGSRALWLTLLVAVVSAGLTVVIYRLLLIPLEGPINDAIRDLLPATNTQRWGGLLLTLLLTVAGIVVSFPLGLLLALGRRSPYPVISTVCTLYIEFVRGVPLITVLFMSQLLVPLVSPQVAEVPNVFRAMTGIILFSAAYLAENVRGGLQAVSGGQIEAARALSMNGLYIILFITLPQALRAVIPALVGQFISLFKDTSLVAIVGLIDLTGISDTVYAQTEFIGRRREALLFIVLIYFTISYSMAQISRRIERTGSGVTRRQQL
jgi:general L-amino acid transport system permease protein